jgi:hypothetical protein
MIMLINQDVKVLFLIFLKKCQIIPEGGAKAVGLFDSSIPVGLKRWGSSIQASQKVGLKPHPQRAAP